MDQVKIHTFGCKVNTYDTSVLEKKLKNLSIKQPLHVINTCAVTKKATLEALKLSRKIKRNDPNSKVVITGCAAQVDTKDFEESQVDLIVANSDKDRIEYYVQDMFDDVSMGTRKIKSDIFKKDDVEFEGGVCESRTRAFLKIQDGCNSFCTFCVIPFARGKSRSLSIENICQRVNDLHQDGIREVVLTGIHIGDYEDETNNVTRTLEDLVESVLLNTKMPRIRLTSLEPKELSGRLLDLYSDERMCPHFHMSIQSMTNKTLAKMRRQYKKSDIERSFNLIYNKIPGAFVGMDLIVGFVTEDEDDFNETYLSLCDLPWTKIHVFPYSERPYTRASKWDDVVPSYEKKRRSKMIRELSESRLKARAKDQIGTTKKVLILKNGKALSRDYWECLIPEGMKKEKEEVSVSITGYEPSILSGKDGALKAS